MPDKWPVGAKILTLKGDDSYREFSRKIEAKTKKSIAASTLQQLCVGRRVNGWPQTLDILAEYAEKPRAWFYEENLPETVAEAQAEYLAPTGDELEDDTRQQIWAAFVRDVLSLRELDASDLEILTNLAKDLARRRKAGE